MKYYVFLLYFLLFSITAFAAKVDTAYILRNANTLITYNNFELFEDKTDQLSFDQVQSANFEVNKVEIPNNGLSKSAFWLRFTFLNKTTQKSLLLQIPNPLLDEVTAYFPGPDHTYQAIQAGQSVPSHKNQLESPDVSFKVQADPNEATTVYLRIKSRGPILVPIYVGTTSTIMKKIVREDMLFGIYLGIILVMLFYNLFIYSSVRDIDYFLYVIFIASVGITQICLKGYGYQYLWHNSRFITSQSVLWCGAFSGIATLVFAKSFLRTRETLPFINKVFNVFIIADIGGLLFSLLNWYQVSYQIINTTALIGCIIVISSSIILSVKGYKPAKFFLSALSFFLLSVIIYVLEQSSIVPFNIFTQNILLIGSAVEITLLSFALADKINSYKKEKEISQANALQASVEKEQLVREQNVILESKVKERTFRLEEINAELNQAMDNLKKAESQLVHAEKMASLGLLTAGIAHEINNPINFVKSNIKPLKLDIQEMMQLIGKYQQISRDNVGEKLDEIEAFAAEIDLVVLNEEVAALLAGIEEGSSRTADIVKGLRTFSRVDEGEFKEVDIHEGIDATMNLLNNILPPNLSVIKEYGDLPKAECYPGRLNQVFMNILTNAIHAITAKPHMGNEKIIITTTKKEECVVISITDTGIGIPDTIKNKIFDPFFTTKDVGEGTGLGLSMVFSIIQKHQGQIEVQSEEGKGSTFIITLPVKQLINGQRP